MTIVGLTAALSSGRALYAAVELLAFDVIVDAEEVVIAWHTANEYDLTGFDLFYKPADASLSAYELIDTLVAAGGPKSGQSYQLTVTDYLNPGVIYCFQLRERPIEGDRGEIFERCGYGLQITPTPTQVPPSPTVPTATPDIATEAIVTPFQEGLDEDSTTEEPGIVIPTDTTTPVSQSPLETPTATPQGDSPLATPTETITDTTANLSRTTGSIGQNSTALPTALIANAPYIILTATPTIETIALAPTFTAYPTAAPTAGIALLPLPMPGTQSLMIMLLCGVFFRCGRDWDSWGNLHIALYALALKIIIP